MNIDSFLHNRWLQLLAMIGSILGGLWVLFTVLDQLQLSDSINNLPGGLAVLPTIRDWLFKNPWIQLLALIGIILGVFWVVFRILAADAYKYYQKGVTSSALGEYREAIENFTEAIRRKPNFASALNHRGIIYGTLGRYQLALQDFEKALLLESDSPWILSNRAVANARLGRHKQAIRDLDKALRMDPNDPRTIFNKACVYSLMNEPERAIEWLRKAIFFEPKYREDAKVGPDFNNIRNHLGFKELIGE